MQGAAGLAGGETVLGSAELTSSPSTSPEAHHTFVTQKPHLWFF